MPSLFQKEKETFQFGDRSQEKCVQIGLVKIIFSPSPLIHFSYLSTIVCLHLTQYKNTGRAISFCLHFYGESHILVNICMLFFFIQFKIRGKKENSFSYLLLQLCHALKNLYQDYHLLLSILFQLFVLTKNRDCPVGDSLCHEIY